MQVCNYYSYLQVIPELFIVENDSLIENMKTKAFATGTQLRTEARKMVHWVMVTINAFRKMALSFPGTSEQPHFEKSSFRVGKKIFATLDVKNKIACIKLPAIDQDVFSAFDKTIIYPVPSKWGQQGWTYIHLQQVRRGMLADAMTAGYVHIAPKKISALIKQDK